MMRATATQKTMAQGPLALAISCAPDRVGVEDVAEIDAILWTRLKDEGPRKESRYCLRLSLKFESGGVDYGGRVFDLLA